MQDAPNPTSVDSILASTSQHDGFIEDRDDLGWRVHVYAHTHWDREWYRTYERFRMQLVGVIDRVLHVLDSDPRFATFVLDGQTILLEDYLKVRPQEEPRIKRLVAAGRLEIGPWHVLADEFLVSGESLVRNLLEGRRIASRFGHTLAVGYLPDPFGHIAQLPAILRGFGIDNVIFSRGMGDQYDQTGSEFRWQAVASGVDVIAVVQGSPYTSGYCNAELLGRGHSIDDHEGLERVAELVPYLVEGSRVQSLLLAAGCDHETIQEELPDIVNRIGEQLGCADVRLSGLESFVASVREREKELDRKKAPLMRWQGELRGSLHTPILTSIFSSRLPLKQANDRLQTLLEKHVEPLMAAAVVAGVRPLRDVDPFLRHAWRLALENHPHDSIGGCSIDEVHAEMPARSMRAEAVAHGLIEDLRIAIGLGDVDVIHDPYGWGGIAEREDGTPITVTGGVPGLLMPLSELRPRLAPDKQKQVAPDEIVLNGVRVAIGTLGVHGRKGIVIERGEESTLIEWVDVADVGDEYDFGALEGDQELFAQIESTRVDTHQQDLAEMSVRYRIDIPKSICSDRKSRSDQLVTHYFTVRVRVSCATPMVELVLDLDNHSFDHRLRMRATVEGLSKDSAVQALGHFAIISRPVRPVAPIQDWGQDPPGSNHCLGAVRAEHVMLAGRGVHEYEADAGHLELTVLRSVGWLSRDDVQGRLGHAGPAIETPSAQMVGPHRVHIAVGVGDAACFDRARGFLSPPLLFEAFREGQSSRPSSSGDEAYVLESGAMARARDVLRDVPEFARERIENLGLQVGGEGVVVSAIKLADDGSGDLIVRWWAPQASKGSRGKLSIAATHRDVQRARLDESTLGPAKAASDGSIDIPVAPGAIVTLRVRF